MLPILFAGFVLAAASGLFLLFAYERRDRGISLALASIVAAGLMSGSGFVAYPIAQSNTQATKVGGYVQMLNGSIVATHVDDIHCYEAHEDAGGSNCSHTERCDEYTDWVWESQPAGTDSKGKTIYKQVLVPEDKWNDCPLMTDEYTYTVTGVAYHTFTYTIASHIFGPNSRHLRGDTSGIPTAVPAQWQRAKDDLAAGNSDPITVPDTYDNYILGSDSQLLQAQSSDISRLTSKQLLPSIVTSVHDLYLADKVSFVDVHPNNAAAWQNSLMHFNAAFGPMKQGDMRVVIIKASALTSTGVSPDDYIMALKAHWQSDFGKDAFPKNGVVVVLATNDTGSTIQWARAETGMPIGNHEMTVALSLRLQDQSLDPNALFGVTRASVTQGSNLQVTYTLGNGIIPQTVMVDYPFDRACMGCTSAADKSKGQQGFVDLKSLIPVTAWGIFYTVLSLMGISIVLIALLMLVVYLLTSNTPRFWQPRQSTWPY